ncbi:hypothetical protein DL96DRAFT_1571499 [Flagelloscypha sp. PMI_526]|nr:hypothetical protein DL96DRAFT_1571499 [Flagelloscypha sp. PMI_526]
MSYACPTELPAELWTQILTYLSDDDIVRLKGLNQTFWHAALDISYGTLKLTPFPKAPKFPFLARLFWLSRLRKKLRRFRRPYAACCVTTVHVFPTQEYTVWSHQGLLDHFNLEATWQFWSLLFLGLCLWPIHWIVNNIIKWQVAFLEPTFWLSQASSSDLSATLANLHHVHTLRLEEITSSHFYNPRIKPTYHLKDPIPSFILCAFDSFAPSLQHLELKLYDKGFDGFPCYFPALKSLEVVLSSRNAWNFLPKIRSSIKSSVFLEQLSLETRCALNPPVVEHPLPSDVHFSFLRILKLCIEPCYTAIDRRSAQNISELISQYRTQLEELEIKFHGFMLSQGGWDDPHKHVFSDSICLLPNLEVLQRLSIILSDVRPWEPVGGGWFDTFMANLDRSSTNSLTHLSIEITQIVYPQSQLALLPNLEAFRLKASDLSVKLLASIPAQMPNLRRFHIFSEGKIVSASSLDIFIENGKLDKLQILSEELGRPLDKSVLANTMESRIDTAEIWLAPGLHAILQSLRDHDESRKQPKRAHMDDLVRVFSDHIPSLQSYTT